VNWIVVLIVGLMGLSSMSIERVKTQPFTLLAGIIGRSKYLPIQQALFKIASISKLYIATATVMLVNDGVLSLDDTLADHFPELVGRIENADQNHPANDAATS
jgi:D-alanyl-D-alanine carboxypeptidase